MANLAENTSPHAHPRSLLSVEANRCSTQNHNLKRRGGRVVESARLESVFTLTGNEGSNPSLSAIIDQSDRASSPYSMPSQNPAQTSPFHLQLHRLLPPHEAQNVTQKLDQQE